VLRKIIGAKRKEVTGDWIKLYNIEFLMKEIKSSRMKWTNHVACMGGEQKCIQGFNLETRRNESTWKTYA